MHESEAIMLDRTEYDYLMKHMEEMAEALDKILRLPLGRSVYNLGARVKNIAAPALQKHKVIKERI